MSDENIRWDIRVIKYENYVKRHPHKAYGHYCRGKLFSDAGQYKKAEDCFHKALTLNRQYTVAVIGLIKAYVFRGKFLKAVKLYDRYAADIEKKNIYKLKLGRALSDYYESDGIETRMASFLSQLTLLYAVHKMLRRYREGSASVREPDNRVVNLLLCIYYLSVDDDANQPKETGGIYNACVRMPGISDLLRWVLIKKVSEIDSEIYDNVEIAGLFSGIPDHECPQQYANQIVNVGLKQQKIHKVNKICASDEGLYKRLTSANLWTYVFMCQEKGIFDMTVYQCCTRLLKTGWVDKMLAETFGKLKDLEVVNHVDADKADAILVLYGYKG